jgi:hypothetical protein
VVVAGAAVVPVVSVDPPAVVVDDDPPHAAMNNPSTDSQASHLSFVLISLSSRCLLPDRSGLSS